MLIFFSRHYYSSSIQQIAVALFVVQLLISSVAVGTPIEAKIVAQQKEEKQQQDKAVEDDAAGQQIAIIAENHDESTINAYITANKLLFIDSHNLAFEKGTVPFSVAPNHLLNLTPAEYKRICGFRPQLKSNSQMRDTHSVLLKNSSALPEMVDWRQKGAVSTIKDQGQCGSCWAFSANGAIEGALAARNNTVNSSSNSLASSLSEQNLLDCSQKYGNEGCDGGLMDNAFQYVQDNDGVDTETAYPYQGEAGKCHFSKEAVGATVRGFKDLLEGSEEQLKIAVATIGPISAAIDADNWSFELYNSGVYYEKGCSSLYLDHAVLVVGYGTDQKHGDYWLVKNSWGEDWGEDGYVRMARNRNNHCGIASMASYPII